MRDLKIDSELELKILREDQAEELAATVMENLPHLKPWMLWATDDYELEHARSFIRQNQRDNSDDKAPTFGIFYQGKISGCIGFVKLDRKNKSAEIGYWISAAQEGKGLVTRCCRALIEHAVDRYKVASIEIHAAASNLRSRSVPERLGFALADVLKGQQLLPGRTDDLAIYSLKTENWQKTDQIS